MTAGRAASTGRDRELHGPRLRERRDDECGLGKRDAAVELASSGVEEPSGRVAHPHVMWSERGSVPALPELRHQDVADRQVATQVQRAQAVIDRMRIEVGVEGMPAAASSCSSTRVHAIAQAVIAELRASLCRPS